MGNRKLPVLRRWSAGLEGGTVGLSGSACKLRAYLDGGRSAGLLVTVVDAASHFTGHRGLTGTILLFHG